MDSPVLVLVLVLVVLVVVAAAVYYFSRRESPTTTRRPAAPAPAPRGVACPICHQTVFGDGVGHWQQHVVPDGTGGYTWRCSCGPAPQEWINSAAAGFGLTNHMRQRHGIGRI